MTHLLKLLLFMLPFMPPDVYLPHMQEEEQPDTVINIMYTFEGETTPPVSALAPPVSRRKPGFLQKKAGVR